MPRPKKRWSDLSRRKKVVIIAAGVVQYALLGAALIDLKRQPRERVRGGKGRWAAASTVSFLGPIAYFVFGRKRG